MFLLLTPQAVRRIYARWLRRDLAAAFASWHRLGAHVAAARRFVSRRRLRLLSWVWATWQDEVFQAGVERGGVLHERHMQRRALRSWHAASIDARRGAELRAQLQQRLARKVRVALRGGARAVSTSSNKKGR